MSRYELLASLPRHERHATLVGIFLTLAMLAALLILVGSALAAESVPLRAETTVDVRPALFALADFIVPILIVLVAAPGFWLAVRLWAFLGLKIDARHRAAFDHAADKAIGFVISRLSDRTAGGIPITFKNDAIGLAVDYVNKAVPDALKHFGKKGDDLADMIEARLENVLVDPENERMEVIASVRGRALVEG